jgi:protein gp37
MENTNIEWCDHTFNPWQGCQKISPGCANCYAEANNARWNGGTAPNWGPGAPRLRTSTAYWRQPIVWDRNAAETAAGLPEGTAPHRPRIFCASLADWLDDAVPVRWRLDLLDIIRRTPHLDWLLLTKRPQNFVPLLTMARHEAMTLSQTNDTVLAPRMATTAEWIHEWLHEIAVPANIWIGTSVEDQLRADERAPALLNIPAKVRFLSCEPLLGPVNLEREFRDGGIHWVIAGGESGRSARPMHPDWARGLRDNCTAAGVPFLFKQWGEFGPAPIGDGPDLVTDAVFKKCPAFDGELWHLGKKAAGRTLDGREWNEFPTVA